MQHLFKLAEICLYCPDVEQKLAATEQAWQAFQSGTLEMRPPSSAPRTIDEVAMPDAPRRVAPKELPKRRMNTPEGKIALVHAVAHIEFNAIHLAWDILYRFRDMPAAFYENWLQVAHDEKRHFCLLRDHLRRLGSDYGALPAHGGLWGMAEKTADDLIARLALVPRYLEARGLDVTPAMLEKFYAAGDLESAAILEIILHDEVSHVQFGTIWFHHACAEANFCPDETYFDQLDRFMTGRLQGPLNRPLRKEAGFSEQELDRLEDRIRA